MAAVEKLVPRVEMVVETAGSNGTTFIINNIGDGVSRQTDYFSIIGFKGLLEIDTNGSRDAVGLLLVPQSANPDNDIQQFLGAVSNLKTVLFNDRPDFLGAVRISGKDGDRKVKIDAVDDPASREFIREGLLAAGYSFS